LVGGWLIAGSVVGHIGSPPSSFPRCPPLPKWRAAGMVTLNGVVSRSCTWLSFRAP